MTDKLNWYVGNVIEFGNGESYGLAIIVKIASHKYSTATLMGAFPGYVGAPKNEVWRKGASYPTVFDLKKNYQKCMNMLEEFLFTVLLRSQLKLVIRRLIDEY